MFPHEVVDLKEISDHENKPSQATVKIPIKRNQIVHHLPELELLTIDKPYEELLNKNEL